MPGADEEPVVKEYENSPLKGASHQLVENGRIDWKAMKKNYITQQDLVQQLRLVDGTEKLESIKKAYFERNGDISFIKNPPPPRVLEVKVENGVQTVRIVIEP